MDKLKPSQLLRLGSQHVRQIRENYFETDGKNNIIGACAIGMMVIAKVGHTNMDGIYNDAINEIENELDEVYSIPAYAVRDCNDFYKETPEEIADYLELRGA